MMAILTAMVATATLSNQPDRDYRRVAALAAAVAELLMAAGLTRIKRSVGIAILLVIPAGISLGYVQSWWQDYQPWNDRGEVTVLHLNCERAGIPVQYEVKIDAGGREQWKVIRPDEGIQGASAPKAFVDREIVYILDLLYLQPEADGSVREASLDGEAACLRISASDEPPMYVRISLAVNRHVRLVVSSRGITLDDGDRGIFGDVTWRERPWDAPISDEDCDSLRAQ